jgi:hypothetical protein
MRQVREMELKDAVRGPQNTKHPEICMYYIKGKCTAFIVEEKCPSHGGYYATCRLPLGPLWEASK